MVRDKYRFCVVERSVWLCFARLVASSLTLVICCLCLQFHPLTATAGNYSATTSNNNDSWTFGYFASSSPGRFTPFDVSIPGRFAIYLPGRFATCLKVCNLRYCKKFFVIRRRNVSGGIAKRPKVRNVQVGNWQSVAKRPVTILWSCYAGRWWVGCYIWYSEEGTGRGPSPPRPLIAVPNVTAYPSTASVPITVLLYNGPLLWCAH